jgi:hypothetical protein
MGLPLVDIAFSFDGLAEVNGALPGMQPCDLLPEHASAIG